MGGFLFTFLSEDGGKCSKIDRVLVGTEFLNRWPEASLLALPKKYSDHRPLILTCADQKFGPKPFRFFNSWLRHANLEGLVKECVRNCQVRGAPDLVFAEKLQACKRMIKVWRKGKGVDRDENGLILKLETRVNELDSKAEYGDLTDDEIKERLDCQCKVEEAEKCELLDLKQRARIKWAVEGDENSAFFMA
ncbi:uncharacterized protein LOC143604483 [Bidens hawaiensis]|uniref:uncharacterized protein LOC143604483 n=1 Tax=Bidens hawaiensis TaxID=980011 RepID=UPI00404A1DDB